MRNRKTIVLLLVAIALLAAANLAISLGGGGAESGSKSILKWEKGISEITISRKDGRPTVLRKNDLRWRIVSPFDGSADEQMILKMLDTLANVPVADMISESDLLRLGRTRADFSLEEPVLALSLVGDEGRKTEISFGVPTPSGEGVYVAVSGVNAVYVTPLEVLAAADLSADKMRRRSLFLVSPESVSFFDIRKNKESVLSFSRSDTGWTVSGERASTARVNGFLEKITAADADRFVWPTGETNETENVSSSQLAVYGLDPDSAVTVTLKCVDGDDRAISFGKEAGVGMVYALAQGGHAVVTVPRTLKDAALQDRVMFTDSRIFPVESKQVESFMVAEGDTVYALARDGNGGWRIESPITAAADTETVTTILTRIMALSPSDTASEGLTVSIATNMRPVAVARSLVLGKSSFADLRSKEIIRIDPSTVRRLVSVPSVKGAKPTSVVYMRDRRTWNVENAEDDATVYQKGVDRVLAAVNPLVAVRVENLKVSASGLGDYGLDRPFLTIAIDQDRDDSVRRNVIIGDRTAGGRYATVGSSDAVFVISEKTVNDFLAPLVSVGK